ncbi:MAG: signal peptidase II [Bacteroidota bacterium]
MRVLWLSALVLLIDQVTKQVVLRTMYRGQSIPVLGDWLKLTYTENPGMAFGISFGPPGTVAVLATIATLLIIVYLFQVRRAYLPYRLSLAAVLGGALGNILDRVFYGVIYGYGPLFQGRVVDFVHVDAWRGVVPEWVPGLGGDFLMLFPIWNGADMAIVAGVVGILIFQHRFHEQIIAWEAAREAEEARAAAATDPEASPAGEAPELSAAAPSPSEDAPVVASTEPPVPEPPPRDTPPPPSPEA